MGKKKEEKKESKVIGVIVKNADNVYSLELDGENAKDLTPLQLMLILEQIKISLEMGLNQNIIQKMLAEMQGKAE